MYNSNLGQLFEQVVQANMNQVALCFSEEEQYEYSSLNIIVNQTARLLKGLGIGYRCVVCVVGDKTVETYAVILACLKIGAAYAILDPESPVERLNKILTRCAPDLVISPPKLSRALKERNNGLSLLDRDEQYSARLREQEESDCANSGVTGSDPAYIMFTSGSTGFPKGAVMTHQNLLNFIQWSVEEFGFGPGERLTNINPLYFDNSVFDLYSALFSGAALVPILSAEISDTKQLMNKLDRLECTSWFSVPSLLIYLITMRAVQPGKFSRFRRFIFGGEGFPKSKLKILFDAYRDQSDFINVYGPTECTCICSAYRIDQGDFDDLAGYPPLGNLIKNFDYLILDEEHRSVPHGETGELCLRGPQVGLGYYNDPENTDKAFIENPLNSNFVERIYKTGDLVRLGDDGKLYILGRKDNQVKHKGYRIELEEIETALDRLDYVDESAVIQIERNDVSQLVGFLAVSREVDKELVREDLTKYLPNYMIPTMLRFRSPLPKNANGKVDRKILKDEFNG